MESLERLRMSDSFRDRLQKAACLQTDADKKARAEQRAQELAAWAAKEPERQALKEKYNTQIKPAIDSIAGQAKSALEKQQNLIFVEVDFSSSDPHILVDRRFSVQLEPVVKGHPPVSNLMRAQMIFQLNSFGHITAEVPHAAGNPIKTHTDVDGFTSFFIEAAFEEMFKVVGQRNPGR
jgi:hypothetical protein